MTKPRSRPIPDYQRIAEEYYTPGLHPTCANFRAGSRAILLQTLPQLLAANSSICELGAGKSVVLEILLELGGGPYELILTDESDAMLAHTDADGLPWVRTVVCEASALACPDESFHLVVASLADPYNALATWREVRRVLRPEGFVIVTSPSYAWASAFRRGTHSRVAEFVLRDGSAVHVPSMILPMHEQQALFESAGLELVRMLGAQLSGIHPAERSSKLSDLEEHEPVVDGFICRRSVVRA